MTRFSCCCNWSTGFVWPRGPETIGDSFCGCSANTIYRCWELVFPDTLTPVTGCDEVCSSFAGTFVFDYETGWQTEPVEADPGCDDPFFGSEISRTYWQLSCASLFPTGFGARLTAFYEMLANPRTIANYTGNLALSTNSFCNPEDLTITLTLDGVVDAPACTDWPSPLTIEAIPCPA